jgi:toxin FitB
LEINGPDGLQSRLRRFDSDPSLQSLFPPLFARVQPCHALSLSVITIGELRQGVENIRHRGDSAQAARLERWLDRLTEDYADFILPFDRDMAQIWGRLRAPHPENPLDKQIAATALIHDLTVVTRNTDHYEPTSARIQNPFA